ELLPDAEERARVADRALDLEAVADDAGILQQTFDARRIELGECPVVIVALLEDRGPAESRLSALERQELEENAVVMHGHAPLAIVILDVERGAGPGAACRHARTLRGDELLCHEPRHRRIGRST